MDYQGAITQPPEHLVSIAAASSTKTEKHINQAIHHTKSQHGEQCTLIENKQERQRNESRIQTGNSEVEKILTTKRCVAKADSSHRNVDEVENIDKNQFRD